MLPQRLPVLLDWYRVLNTKERADRFRAWGIINDPECCTPGSPNCPKKSLAETFGMDYCPGDDELLKFVGKAGYRDPGCDLQDDAPASNDPHKGQRDSGCGLDFGTSSGAMGIRKFPNPRFDAEKWRKVNGSPEFLGRLHRQDHSPRRFASKLADGSIEPPFYFGTACGACHIAFDPLNPPKDPANPRSENIKGVVGNQYTTSPRSCCRACHGRSPCSGSFNYVRRRHRRTPPRSRRFHDNPGTPNAHHQFRATARPSPTRTS